MRSLVATVEHAGSIADHLWGVFALVLTLVTAALVMTLALTALVFDSPPPGLTRARPWIAGLVGLTFVVVLVAYLGAR